MVSIDLKELVKVQHLKTDLLCFCSLTALNELFNVLISLLSLFPFLKYGFLIDFHDVLDTYDGYFKLLNNKVLTYIRLIHMVYVGNNSLQGAVLCNVLSV